MSGEQRLAATPAGVRLCPIAAIADPGARGFVLQMKAGRFHGFVVHRSGEARGYVDRCPHAGLPLARQLDDYLTPDRRLIACGWHGALFSPLSGLCVGGPCAGQRLAPWPVALRDGMLVTAPPGQSQTDQTSQTVNCSAMMRSDKP